MVYQMRLRREPFDKIQSGEKTIELRLLDEKRQELEVGDEIVFSCVEDDDEFFKAKIIGLHVFDSFAELYKKLPLLKCGYTIGNLHAADPKDMNQYYSTEEQKKYGVVGIELEVFYSAFKIKHRTCGGITYDCFEPENIGQLEENIIEKYDPRIADLFALFLDEEFPSVGVVTPEDLFEDERKNNTDDGEPIYRYSATLESGALLTSVEQVKDIFQHIWKSYLFMESTDMDFMMIQYYNKLKSSQDVNEVLFWSFRFCAWGGRFNPLPYTLYRAIIDGRFNDYYDKYPQWQDDFIVK